MIMKKKQGMCKMRKVNSLDVAYFLKVAETLNFSKAASELSISQPALSKQIKKFEKELEISLFKRSTKQVELTTAGELLYKEYKNLLLKFETVTDRAKEQQNIEYRTYRIGMVEFAKTQKYVEKFLCQFSQKHPEIKLILEVNGFSQLKQQLEQNELDLVFSFQQEIELKTEWIQQLRLFPLHLGIIVPASNSLYQRASLKICDLSQETFFVFSGKYSNMAQKNIHRHCASVGFCPMSYKEYPNLLSLKEGMLKKGGITMGYKEFFDSDAKFKFFPIVEDERCNYFVAAWKRCENDKLQPLLSYLKETIL